MLERLEWLIGDKLELIKKTNILIIGIGGVGSYALETLIRSGIGKITIVDCDTVSLSNLNRQLMTLNDNIGLNKVDVFYDRINKINKNCEVIKINKFIDTDNLKILFNVKYDYVIDACDTLNTKAEIIKYCVSNKIKFISSLGMACRLDSSKIKFSYLSKTYNDPLAKKLRLLLKDEKIIKKIPVVFSEELPVKNGKLGSVAHVPATAGLLITNYIINDILGEL